ncbi:MarR family transcriptional regulator [Nocardiopsis potens]|uniref:MarR family transcriptional regulator n=1 Tax=Nocardiopsis potens TaxID=1246458 RepID=UPI0003473B39|nr:MarR family transcriptional regulator [Nocardiopsis potens]
MADSAEGRPEPEEGAAGPREGVLHRVAEAGRAMSDAAVLYHGELSSRLGLGATDWKILGLVQAAGSVSAGELVRRSGLKPASITGVLDRLERRGLLRRVRDEADRRRVLVEPAPGLEDGRVELFEGLLRRLAELCGHYTDAELELVAGFMEEAARRQLEATAELQGQEPPER